MREKSGRGKSRLKIWDLIADVRCSQAVLDFLSTTDVGRLLPAEEHVRSKVLEWEIWGHRGRGGERGTTTGELGADGEEQPLFLPTPSLMASAEES